MLPENFKGTGKRLREIFASLARGRFLFVRAFFARFFYARFSEVSVAGVAGVEAELPFFSASSSAR